MIDPTTILGLARSTLLDPDGVYWTTDELTEYLNAGIRSLCGAKPDAYTRIIDHRCVDGALQAIPDDGIQLFDVPRNVGGRVIRQTSMDSLDNSRPDWMQADPGTVVKHFTTDVRYPKRFYVYPPSDDAQIELVYGAVPAPVGGAGTGWSLSDFSDMAISADTLQAAYPV